MLVFFDKLTSEADRVLGSFCIEMPWAGNGSEYPGLRNYLALDFDDLGTVFLETRNSGGVWAKNSARDITG